MADSSSTKGSTKRQVEGLAAARGRDAGAPEWLAKRVGIGNTGVADTKGRPRRLGLKPSTRSRVKSPEPWTPPWASPQRMNAPDTRQTPSVSSIITAVSTAAALRSKALSNTTTTYWPSGAPGSVVEALREVTLRDLNGPNG